MRSRYMTNDRSVLFFVNAALWIYFKRNEEIYNIEAIAKGGFSENLTNCKIVSYIFILISFTSIVLFTLYSDVSLFCFPIYCASICSHRTLYALYIEPSRTKICICFREGPNYTPRSGIDIYLALIIPKRKFTPLVLSGPAHPN